MGIDRGRGVDPSKRKKKRSVSPDDRPFSRAPKLEAREGRRAEIRRRRDLAEARSQEKERARRKAEDGLLNLILKPRGGIDDAAGLARSAGKLAFDAEKALATSLLRDIRKDPTVLAGPTGLLRSRTLQEQLVGPELTGTQYGEGPDPLWAGIEAAGIIPFFRPIRALRAARAGKAAEIAPKLSPSKRIPAAASAEPPVPKGHIRLYRGEGAIPMLADDPMARADAALNRVAGQGRWFSPNKEYASTYPRGAPQERLLYVDVPADAAWLDQFRGVRGLSAEIWPVPESVVAKANPLPAGKPPGERVREALGPARKKYAAQKALRREELGKRVARAEEAREAAGGGIAGHRAALGELRGELPKTKFEHLREGRLAQNELDDLFRTVEEHPELQFFEKVRAHESLRLAFSEGRTPPPGEVELLRRVFGEEAATEIARLSKMKLAGKFTVETVNIPRAMMASVDFSAPFRQALVAGARHPKLFSKNFKPMFKAFAKEDAYQEGLKRIHERPTFPLMEKAGVSFTELGGELGKREEMFISRLAERFPLIRRSGRAFTMFLDNMRADMFDRQLELAAKQGVNVEDMRELKGIARLVNNATGRGGLGPIESWAPALNGFFFAPRLIASRINFLNPLWYATLPPFARKQAVISMIRLGSVASAILGIGAYAGAKVGYDPRSADFAKLRIADTRVDILGGFQQYGRFGAQLGTGEIISSTTGRKMTLGPGFGDMSRKDITERFLFGKSNPPVSFVYDFFKGTDFEGEPFDAKMGILKRITPLVAQDALELYKHEDSVPLALLGYAVATFGIGTQTYGARDPQKKALTKWETGARKALGLSKDQPIPEAFAKAKQNSLLRSELASRYREQHGPLDERAKLAVLIETMLQADNTGMDREAWTSFAENASPLVAKKLIPKIEKRLGFGLLEKLSGQKGKLELAERQREFANR